jgi:catechol 2,3-dioxygenase-like lactoylglutathione lyase family enzyme
MITGIDHVVLTVRDPEAAAAFYERALGLPIVRFGEGRLALQAGAQKINLQPLGFETRNHAAIGSGDICLLTEASLEAVRARLETGGIAILEGPVTRTGARGPIASLYFTDPDGNLIEVSRYD